MEYSKVRTYLIYGVGGILSLIIGNLIPVEANHWNQKHTNQQIAKELSDDLVEASISELQLKLDSGRITSVELVDFYLARIEAYDKNGPMLNSIAHINPNVRVEAQHLTKNVGKTVKEVRSTVSRFL